MNLSLMGSDVSTCAVVGYAKTGNDCDQLLPGLNWESYLLFAATYYMTEWAVLTDGLMLKVFRIQNRTAEVYRYWSGFDQIIQQEFLYSFLDIFRIFETMKEPKDNLISSEENEESLHSSLQGPLEEMVLIHNFLVELHARAMTKTSLHAESKVGNKRYFGTSAGRKGMSIGYNVLMDKGRTDLYINTGDKNRNKEEFRNLYQHKSEIEALFGSPLEWHLIPSRKACRIRYTVSTYGVQDTEHWEEFQDLLIDAMIRLEKALHPFLNNIHGQKINLIF